MTLGWPWDGYQSILCTYRSQLHTHDQGDANGTHTETHEAGNILPVARYSNLGKHLRHALDEASPWDRQEEIDDHVIVQTQYWNPGLQIGFFLNNTAQGIYVKSIWLSN